MYAVTFSFEGYYERYYCDLKSGMCSCGCTEGVCIHMEAIALGLSCEPRMLYPMQKKRKANETQTEADNEDMRRVAESGITLESIFHPTRQVDSSEGMFW